MTISRDVLIIEDDVCTRTLLAAIVQHHGFQPTCIGDGNAAIAHLRTRPPGVVILDLLLPRTNGFEILRELKCINPSLLRRTIVVTAAGERTTGDATDLTQVRRVLRKPLDVDELMVELIGCVANSGIPEAS